jgi:hypothetical protein
MTLYIGLVPSIVFLFDQFTPKDDHMNMHYIIIKFECLLILQQISLKHL